MTLLIVAGDPSGDLHGSHLIEALKAVDPSVKIAAVGGHMMKAAADEFLHDLASQGIVGFLEPFRKVGALRTIARALGEFMDRRRPDAVICIDYYGFNRWILSAAKQRSIPTIYYISPQVWASRPGRIKTIKELAGRMLVIFPFEEEIYRKARVPVSFVGHPLLDHMPEPAAARRIATPLKVGLLPGSRTSEVLRHLPVFLDAVERMKRDFPNIEASVFAASHFPDALYADAARRGARIVREQDYAVRAQLDIALCSSGTATLENALLGVPMVVIYKTSWPTYVIARSLIQVPYIAMVNILLKRLVVPELIQHQATSESVAGAALRILEDPRRHQQIRESLLSIRAQLGGPGASERAARLILGKTAALAGVPPDGPQ